MSLDLVVNGKKEIKFLQSKFMTFFIVAVYPDAFIVNSKITGSSIH